MTTDVATRPQHPAARRDQRAGRHAARRTGAAPTQDRTGKIEVCRAEHGSRYHTASCAILHDEVRLPSRHDLMVAFDDLVAEGRDSFVPRPPGVLRSTVREWRSPAVLDPSRVCPCLRAIIAAHPRR
jgi:hypothetical protein